MEEETKFLSRPPTNIKLRRGVEPIVDKNPEKFLKNLKRAFYRASGEKRTLSLKKWIDSGLNAYIHNGKLTPNEFVEYFNKVDANSKGYIEWPDLAMYMICETSPPEKIKNANDKIIEKVEIPITVRQECHRGIITQIDSIPWVQRYITLSYDAIKFWKTEPLELDYFLKNSANFCAFMVFRKSQIMAVALSTRRIIFYNVSNYTLLPVSVGASPTATSIKHMNYDDSKRLLSALQGPDLPLYNCPTIMIEAIYVPKRPYFFDMIVADDCGVLSYFALTTPQRRDGQDYSINLISHKEIHGAAITEIKCLDDLEVYATASLDKTIKFIQIDNNNITILRVFNEINPVVSFCYFEHQHSIVICMKQSPPTVWSTKPPKRTMTISLNYDMPIKSVNFDHDHNQHYMAAVSQNGDVRMFSGQTFLPQGNYESDYAEKFGSMAVDEERHVILLGARFPVLWRSVQAKVVVDNVVHRFSVCGCFFSEDFSKIVSTDVRGVINTFDYKTGVNDYGLRLDVSGLKCVCIDARGRRLFTTSQHGNIDVWNLSSGSILTTIERKEPGNLVGMRFFTFGVRMFLVYATTNKLGVILVETLPGMFTFLSRLEGHTKNITCIEASSKLGVVVTGATGGEIIMWPLDPNENPRKQNVESDVDNICICDDLLFVQCEDGNISVLSLPHMEHLLIIKGMPFQIACQLTAIAGQEDTIVSGDSNGYVTVFKIIREGQDVVSMVPVKVFRCHESEVTQLMFIPREPYLLTIGGDFTMRLWETENFEPIGAFTRTSSWNLEDPQTFTRQDIKEIEKYQIAERTEGFRMQQSLMTARSVNSNGSGLQVSSRSLRRRESILNMAELRSSRKLVGANGSMRSMKSMLSTASLKKALGQIEPEKQRSPSEGSIDWDAAFEMISSYYSGGSAREYQVQSLDEVERREPEKENAVLIDPLIEDIIANDPSKEVKKISESTKSFSSKKQSRVESKLNMIVRPMHKSNSFL